MSSRASSPIVLWVVAFVLLLAPLGFTIGGAVMVWKQHSKLSSWPAVQASITAASIVDIKGSKGSRTYRPHITYFYTVGTSQYSSSNVTPITSAAASHAWAKSMLARFPVGTIQQAYYDPASPADAFLLHEYDFQPYLFLSIGAVIYPLALMAILSGLNSRTRPAEPDSRGGGSWLLPIADTPARRSRRGFWYAFSGIPMLLVPGHYFYVAQPPYETSAYITSGICVAFWLVLLLLWWRSLRVSGLIGDPKIQLSHTPVCIGDPLLITVDVPMFTQMLNGQARLRLLANEAKRTGSGKNIRTTNTQLFEATSPPVALDTAPGGLLTLVLDTELPVTAPATSSPTDNPTNSWVVVLEIQVQGRPKCKVETPLIVKPIGSVEV